MGRGSNKDNVNAKSIDLGEASDGEDGEGEGEEVLMNELEENRRNKLDIFASTSKEKDRVVNRLVQAFAKLTTTFEDTTDDNDQVRASVIRCPQAMKSLRTIKDVVVDFDNPSSKLLSIFLSNSKMVRSNLSKLIAVSTGDEQFMKIVIKIAYVLLSPLSSSVKEVLKMNVCAKKKGSESSDETKERIAIEKQKKTEALLQVNALLMFKEDFSSDAFVKGMFLVIHKALERSRFETNRSVDDSKIIELVLKVISNLLLIDASAGNSSTQEVSHAAVLHQSLLKKLHGPISDLVVSFCADLSAKDNQELLSICIDIIANIVRKIQPEELVEVEKTVSEEDINSTAQVAPAVDANRDTQRRSKNLLAILNAEASERQKIAGSSLSGQRRMQGVYQTLSPEGLPRRVTANPYQPMATLTTASRKSKKVKAFSQDNVTESVGCKDRDALLTVADFIDKLIRNGGFSQVVFRVKEHLRRGDNSIGPDEEDAFHRVVAFCLKYYRLKLEQDQQLDDKDVWVPKLQPIMQALDRMSFHRCGNVIKVFMEAKKVEEASVVVETYCEMLAYLRLLLCSSDTCHHELAVAALFSVFYRSSDRLDPLPVLLRDWKPSVFDRKYASVLLELVHQTMKVIDKAKSVFAHKSTAAVSSKKAKKKNDSTSDNYEMALEQYTAAVVQFDTDEYFKRLASNQVIRLYSQVLERFATNPKKVNHYAYVFFDRLVAFGLDSSTYSLPSTTTTEGPSSVSEGSLTLGHLLFNVQTLATFDAVLSNRAFLAANTYLAPLVALIKSVVRRFFFAADKNHMLFVEALMQHPHAQSFIEKVDNVYDAATYGRPDPSMLPAASSRRYDDEYSGDDEPLPADRRQRNDDVLGDEFDETDLSAPFMRSAPNEAKQKRSSKPTKRVRQSKGAWTAEEDGILREQYKLYRGSRSIFETIALSRELRDLRPHMNAKAVERRVTELELHLEAADAMDEEHDDAEAEDTAPTAEPSEPSGGVSEAAANKVAIKDRKSMAAVWDNISADGGDDDDKWTGRRAVATSTARVKLSKRKWLESDSEDDGFTDNLSVGDAAVAPGPKRLSNMRLIDDDDDYDE